MIYRSVNRVLNQFAVAASVWLAPEASLESGTSGATQKNPVEQDVRATLAVRANARIRARPSCPSGSSFGGGKSEGRPLTRVRMFQILSAALE